MMIRDNNYNFLQYSLLEWELYTVFSCYRCFGMLINLEEIADSLYTNRTCFTIIFFCNVLARIKINRALISYISWNEEIYLLVFLEPLPV